MTIERRPRYEAQGKRLVRTDQPVHRTLRTAEEGAYEFANLPDGVYRVCVHAPGILNPCQWPGKSFFELSPENRDVTKEIQVQKGCRVRIRIEDPLGLTAESDSPARGDDLKVGVQTARGAVHIARRVSRDTAGREMEVTVPFDTSLRLWVFSRLVEVEDQQGDKLFTRGPNQTFVAPRGQQRRDFFARVTRRLPPPQPFVPPPPVAPPPLLPEVPFPPPPPPADIFPPPPGGQP